MENKTITLIGLAHESYELLRKAEDAVRDSLVFTGFGDGEQPTRWPLLGWELPR